MREPDLSAAPVKRFLHASFPLIIHVLTAWRRGLFFAEIIPHSKGSQMLQPLTIFLAQVSLSRTLERSSCTNCSVRERQPH